MISVHVRDKRRKRRAYCLLGIGPFVLIRMFRIDENLQQSSSMYLLFKVAVKGNAESNSICLAEICSAFDKDIEEFGCVLHVSYITFCCLQS